MRRGLGVLGLMIRLQLGIIEVILQSDHSIHYDENQIFERSLMLTPPERGEKRGDHSSLLDNWRTLNMVVNCSPILFRWLKEDHLRIKEVTKLLLLVSMTQVMLLQQFLR
jgi:hypothetical protein